MFISIMLTFEGRPIVHRLPGIEGTNFASGSLTNIAPLGMSDGIFLFGR